MKEFIHHKIQAISNLIDDYNDAQELYIKKSYELEPRFMNLLNSCKAFFESKGSNTEVSKILNIISLYETAKNGIHPFELKKVTVGKRDLKMMMIYHGLEKLYQELDFFYNKEIQKIEEAEELLSSLMISLVQAGSLSDNMLNQLTSIDKIQAFWEELIQKNDSIATINKRLKLKIIDEDIFIIIDKIISKIKNNEDK